MTFNNPAQRKLSYGLSLVALTLTLTGCPSANNTANAPDGGTGTETTSGETTTSDLSGTVIIDGSSTVFPVSEAMAEEFGNTNPNVQVTVGSSGTGGGFKKFCAGETDMSGASRPIKQEEIDLCAQNNIEYVELPVAFDGISIVVHPENDWATCLSTDELKVMWEPAAEGTINNWNQVKPEFPDQTLTLSGPGTDSGTFDYFTEAVVGEGGASRGDYAASEDDNVIVQGVIGDKGALGYFGFAYFEENKDALKVVPIKNEAGECIEPSREAIADGTYNPLARPIFIYVSKTALETKPEVKAFAEYVTDPAQSELINEVGYIALPDDIIAKVQTRLQSATVGSIFEGGSSLGVKLADKL
ncbi:MAG: PstS family phosphate ABC transporter substrate-binding protein [Chloroflexaceae bacterium]|nr:PstS family phosphate ABC transporter substrate-binding protein [Chloroflexaceae bacterium]